MGALRAGLVGARITPVQPLKEGICCEGPAVNPCGFLEKKPLLVGAAKSLAELLGEFSFCTLAPLYVWGGFTDGPLVDFAWQTPGFAMYYYLSQLPLFDGLRVDDDALWNHLLFAVRREHWQAFHDFILSTSLYFVEENSLFRYASQDVMVPDPLAVGFFSGTVPPALPVVAFGVNASRFSAACVPGVLTVPSFRLFPAAVETVSFAASLAAGDNPHTVQVMQRIEPEGDNGRGETV